MHANSCQTIQSMKVFLKQQIAAFRTSTKNKGFGSLTKLQMELRSGRLQPVSMYDAERIEDYPEGTLFNLSNTGKRSNPQHNLYWSTLRRVAKATGKWPTEHHLHDELKIACGYVRIKLSALNGELVNIPDSISFDKMTQQEFQKYFELAMAKLAEGIGYDPLQT